MAKSKSNDEVVKIHLITYKSDSNGRAINEYETLAEAQKVMRIDYEDELRNNIAQGTFPASAHIEDKEAYVIGIRKCQWQIKEL